MEIVFSTLFIVSLLLLGVAQMLGGISSYWFIEDAFRERRIWGWLIVSPLILTPVLGIAALFLRSGRSAEIVFDVLTVVWVAGLFASGVTSICVLIWRWQKFKIYFYLNLVDAVYTNLWLLFFQGMVIPFTPGGRV